MFFLTWETGQTLRNLASFGSSNSTACMTGVLRDKALVGNVTRTSTLITTPMKNDKKKRLSLHANQVVRQAAAATRRICTPPG